MLQLKEWKYSENSAYVHYCPNETIQGVAIHELRYKQSIADMSSVILSEPLDGYLNFSLNFMQEHKKY